MQLRVHLMLICMLLLAQGLVSSMAAQIADAVIEIVAMDQSGAALPGVAVTISKPETGLQRTALTDSSGVARTPGFPPGTYDVKLELPGFETLVEKCLTVRVGQIARARLTLGVAQVSETVDVLSEAPLLDPFKTDSSTNIVPEQIESLPVPDRDFQRLAFLTPGVQRERGVNRFIGNGPLIGAAGNASQTTIMVDGVDLTDPMAGLARVRFSQEAIGEFRVIANRFDPEIGGSSSGAISVVTKSGTNDVNGSVFGFFRDKSFRAKGPLDLQKNDYSRQQFGLTLGGPIVQDRTHYFAAFEQINEDTTVTFRPGGAFTSQAADGHAPLNQSLPYGSIDHRIGDRQSLRVKFAYEHYRQENFRVGGVVDPSAGIRLKRQNWNLMGTHSWTLGEGTLNQVSAQVGRRQFQLPNNSQRLGEYFSSGNTLQTGANILGDQSNTGDIFEVRDSFFTHVGSGRWVQDLKFGGSLQYVKDYWNFPLFPHGLMIWVNDTRLAPLFYIGASGTSEDTLTTNLVSGFVQSNFRPGSRVSLNLGLRYDVDTSGNNPEFTSPLMPVARGRDTNNFQPRAGFSWDATGNGKHVIRGGAGIFTGRIIQQRISGVASGRPELAINPASPATTGVPLPRDALRNSDTFVNPYSRQLTAGYTLKLGSTGLFADFEGIYVKGNDELIVRDLNWRGNAAGGGRLNPAFTQINASTNEGRSKYKAFVTSMNGTLKGGHLITASLTVASKKNITDDFQPALTDYPSDPAHIDAEWGRSRADERVRFVASTILRLPFRFTVAPIFEYGSGQPWNDRIGYDYNGDGKPSDRAAGVSKFSRDGPKYVSVNLRVTHRMPLGRLRADIIAEAFNLLNRVNYDVNSIMSGRYLSGPTLADPALPYVVNPAYSQFTSTLTPFEAQIGVRVSF